jgi:hypothetical protein
VLFRLLSILLKKMFEKSGRGKYLKSKLNPSVRYAVIGSRCFSLSFS